MWLSMDFTMMKNEYLAETVDISEIQVWSHDLMLLPLRLTIQLFLEFICL